MRRQRICIVGAGVTGATIARVLAEAGHPVDVLEARDHVAGNCHTVWDARAGCFHHVHGPHIFHTDDAQVIEWVSRFTTLRPYRHRVFARARGEVFPLPITLATLEQLFGGPLTPEEARRRIAADRPDVPDPDASFEARALSLVGRQVYETFFRHYTEKQWGMDPARVPAAVMARIPVRFDRDANYFHHEFQGLPDKGYTAMVEAMLDHPRIRLSLGRQARFAEVAGAYTHVFWSGRIEEVFGADAGYLRYRTLDFETEHVAGDFQGCPVINHPEPGAPYTRITQHNHLRPSDAEPAPVTLSLISREFSRDWRPGDLPYYPVAQAAGSALLDDYRARAAGIGKLTLCGRLGLFSYLDMDAAIVAALKAARGFLDRAG